ncbi:hypothetical protein AB0H77_30865 [Streptomyces sp. NPDC050844]
MTAAQSAGRRPGRGIVPWVPPALGLAIDAPYAESGEFRARTSGGFA